MWDVCCRSISLGDVIDDIDFLRFGKFGTALSLKPVKPGVLDCGARMTLGAFVFLLVIVLIVRPVACDIRR
jgi:hypothetical protein